MNSPLCTSALGELIAEPPAQALGIPSVGFIGLHASALGELIAGPLGANPERRGALAALGVVHTVLLCCPVRP